MLIFEVKIILLPLRGALNSFVWLRSIYRCRQWPCGLKVMIKNQYVKLKSGLSFVENGATICDGGCSSGHFSMAMAESLPNSKIVGFDISSHAIQLARSKAEQKGLTNVSFEEVDACNLPTPWERAFDIFVTINVVHDLPFPEKFLQGIRAALKPGGMIFMVESYLHSNVADSKHFSYAPWFYGVSLFHCVPVSLDAGKGAAGLGCTWGIEHQKEILETTGFVDVKQIQKGLVSYNIAFKPKPDQ